MNLTTPFAAATALALALAAAPAQALDASWSGFATLGYARSDSIYTYQRFIDRDGGFKRDTLVAGQLDLSLTPQWSATVQIKVAPAPGDDRAWRAEAAWAFVAWRPDNDWLVRVGKARLPLYLYSESLDIGVASDMARLPHEMYSIAPTNDFTGLYVTRNLTLGARDIGLDVYSGQADATARLWLRDGLPPYIQPGPRFTTVRVTVTGLVLTSRDPGLTWRLGVHSTSTRTASGEPLPVRFPRVDVGPGVGYWKVDDTQPGPAIEKVNRIRNLAITAGAEWQISDSWRLTGEFVRMRQRDTDMGSDSRAGYLALFKRIGAWTPYVSMARQRSSDGLLEWQRRLTQDQMPASIPGAAQVNAVQRMAGESLYVFDQRSQALGVSYALSPTAKIKAEWMRTEVGSASAHFDVPPGQPDVRGLHVNTLSLNLSAAF